MSDVDNSRRPVDGTPGPTRHPRRFIGLLVLYLLWLVWLAGVGWLG